MNGTQTLLKTILTCYNGNFTTCATPPNPVNLPITSKYSYDIFPSGLWDAHVSSFDNNGQLTEADDYDFVMGSFGAPTTRKLITYASNLGNILNRPASIVVEDGATPPNILSQTNFGYDDYSVYGLVLTGSYTPSVPQHGDPPQSQRGNLTSISEWVAGSTYLTKRFTYFDTGVLSTAIDVNGAVARYSYPQPDSTNLTCGYTFPAYVTAPAVNGITLTSSTTWDCNGGVATSTTDPNGKTTSVTAWDPNFWRPTTITSPYTDNPVTYTTTNISYNHATAQPFNPAAVESTLTFNGSNSTVDSRTTLDGLARTHIVQQKQSPTATNYDSVETDYDSSGRPSRQTVPYVATAGVTNSSAAATTTIYDALSRPMQVTTPPQVSDSLSGTVNYTYTNNDVLVDVGPLATGDSYTKRRQYQYDALGRLTFVCELATAASNGTCGLNPAYWGFQTNYTYDAAGRLTGVTQNAQQGAPGSQQTRSFTYDGLGRMLSENNPENSTTYYSYDSGSFCGAGSVGDLAQRLEANGVYTCYAHDALHRQTGIGHYFNSSLLSGSGFIYDAATVNGISLQNPKGRLVGAYNCVAPCTSHQTDTVFSYSARGETTDTWEQTAHSGGYYHVTQSYWEHGAPKQLSNLPELPTITYGGTIGGTVGVDGEGRFTQVTADSGQNPITGASYVTSGTAQPIGALAQVNFGSGDNDQFSYDPHTGQLTGYTFNVGSPAQADIGALTWNANGSLQKLQITDRISGTTDSQTCNYTHDDLGRIASVNCGTPWSQTFSYDPFGNINKSGTLSFQPGTYTTANRVPSSFGFVYDAGVASSIGNVTSDTLHSYTWDADDKMSSVTTNGSTVNLTYDALGRMVEQQRGSNYTQVVYGPGGDKLALMNGQSLTKAFVPLPGGASAVYNASGLQYYRHADHLGSSRLASTPARTKYYSGAYAPFGESYAETGTTDRSFIGQNEDTVPGLADFLFREYSSAQQGRWISPDPAGLGAVSLADPQSWNRYAYVANHPLNSIDPLGTCPQNKDDSLCDEDGWTLGGGVGGGVGSGMSIFGYDMFDAIAGAVGTYITIDKYGKWGFGFSETLWSAEHNIIDAASEPDTHPLLDQNGQITANETITMGLSMDGWNVLVRDNGTSTSVAGSIFDYLADIERIHDQFYDSKGHIRVTEPPNSITDVAERNRIRFANADEAYYNLHVAVVNSEMKYLGYLILFNRATVRITPVPHP